MLTVVSGLVAFGAGGTGLWYFKPRDGVAHAIVTTPLLDTLVPIAIVSLMAIGAALVVAGVVS